MRKNRREIENFLNNFVDGDEGISRIPKSLAFISPGDVLMLTYPKPGSAPEVAIVLVVSNQKGSGMFLSTKNNILLSAFKIDQTPVEVLRIIFSSLYKNRRFSNYSNIKASLGQIFGSSSYRTYNINKITELNELVING